MWDGFKPTNYVDLIQRHDGFFKRLSQVTPLYFLTEADILMVHHYLLQKYGGLEGVKDEGYLSYLCNFIEVKHVHLYHSAFSYLWKLATRHAFNDGNKRLAAACMLWFLETNGEKWSGHLGQLETLIIAIAESKLKEDEAYLHFVCCSGWVVSPDYPS